MSQKSILKLKPSYLLDVPLETYAKDFTFIVNGKKFKTCRLISDILSPIICQTHFIDPTSDKFTITTKNEGDFSHIINLSSFNEVNIQNKELPFILEVIQILGNKSIEYNNWLQIDEITTDNIFIFLNIYEQNESYFDNRPSTEIDFISSHFFELCETQIESFSTLQIETLLKIINNDHFQLNSEDQLLKFVNHLYEKNPKYSILYETVLFENASSEIIKEFLSIFNYNDMTTSIWIQLSKRFECEVKKNRNENNINQKKRYSYIEFLPLSGYEFNGIINHFQIETNGQIEKEINITASSIGNQSENRQPKVVTFFNDQDKYFYTNNLKNSWICFDFINHQIIPSHYVIRSYPDGRNTNHPKSWVIECSNNCDDNDSWEIVDEQINCSYLNDKNAVHVFTMNRQSSKKFKYVRMRLTGPNWNSQYYLDIDSFEIYGKLI